MECQAGHRWRSQLHRGIDIVLCKVDRRIACFQSEIKVGRCLAESFQVGQRSEHCKRWSHADAYDTIVLSDAQDVARAKQLVERVQHGGGVDCTAFSQSDVASPALDQLDAEVRL